jgi:RNA polymerase sigma-70 factor
MTAPLRSLDDVIAATFAEAVRLHGHLGLTLEQWQARVASILRKCESDTDRGTAARLVERLHAGDLYLATACAERHDNAWRRFECLYKVYVQDLVRCLVHNSVQALDLGEGLLVDLFLPDRTGQSRIASYDGRSSLATWLHVIVTHRVTNERVRKWNTIDRPGTLPEIADESSMREFDANMRAARYGRAIVESLRSACEGLTSHESRMLAWRYERGLMLDEIARMLSIHPSTVCRQLDRVQERLRRDVVDMLASRFGIPLAAIQELLRDVAENGTVSVPLLHVISRALRRSIDEGDSQQRHRHIA